ncbi:ABC transporter ATP-binding protein [Bifidobacterium aemilianum]|uniref:ABC transporter ATP-binding protein n=2 Tax=Bifidobacterium aemilianum TaxID=2493120 RepID=A0A366K739_9BIFI|nr:ABC transporter ATP-binding protein [Bifidobacterium aemilianum]
METVPIPARKVVSSFGLRDSRRRLGQRSAKNNLAHSLFSLVYGVWVRLSSALAGKLDWRPMVEPYVGYGNDEYSRLVCRTVYAPRHSQSGRVLRGIRGMLAIPAPGIHVSVAIDGVPVSTLQVGKLEVYDKVDPGQGSRADEALTDASGYLDLVVERRLEPGPHEVTYQVAGRAPVSSQLFAIPSDTQVGLISDVDDTILVTQVPTLWKAAYNLLLLNPRKRVSVPGMSVLYNKIADLFPQAPFVYLSTSPWNVEGSIRQFIGDQGYPMGPLLLRDMDPRPKSSITSGVHHKLEFTEQLMADFPHMKFILIGDDGQKDPTTYATIARRYPGRVLAIGIRQLSPRESSPLGRMSGLAATQPMPVTDVPVFNGTTGANLMKTMLPYLRQFH